MFRSIVLYMVLPALVGAAPDLGAATGKGTLLGLDTNHDGLISRQEAVAAQKRAFHHLDQNGDGHISRPEFDHADLGNPAPGKLSQAQKKQRAQARKAWFDNLDRNGDGQISLNEYQAGLTPYFNRLDRNGDGVIDGRELKKAFDSGGRGHGS